MKDEITPKFIKARPLPHAMRWTVETELDRLQNLGIFSPVQCSKWAMPVALIL